MPLSKPTMPHWGPVGVGVGVALAVVVVVTMQEGVLPSERGQSRS